MNTKEVCNLIMIHFSHETSVFQSYSIGGASVDRAEDNLRDMFNEEYIIVDNNVPANLSSPSIAVAERFTVLYCSLKRTTRLIVYLSFSNVLQNIACPWFCSKKKHL